MDQLLIEFFTWGFLVPF